MNYQETLTPQNHSNNVDSLNTTLPEKVHIRGLDDLTTNDIKAFSTEHCPQHPPVRVEWVDDTSANIVFDDSAAAQGALENFTLASLTSDVSSISPIQLRDAKALSTHPDSRLQVRTALSTDQKRPKAYEASRFYMMHPEHDPREQRRRKEQKQHHGHGGYRSRRYGDDEQRRRRHRDREEGFDPSMYDDKDTSSRQDSMDMSSDTNSRNHAHNSRTRLNSYRPLRDRSASPDRQRDFSRRRRRTPPPSYRLRDPHPFPSDNNGKELFPSKSSGANNLENRGKDLFSNKLLAEGLKKELFPQKAKNAHHRRSDAFDAADETADMFANGLPIPLKENSHPSPSLVDRITSRSMTDGRLGLSKRSPSSSIRISKDPGVNILGASAQHDMGFSIRGGASAAGTIKELFPGKALGNEGKELFAEKLQGRGGRRNRAADMFH